MGPGAVQMSWSVLKLAKGTPLGDVPLLLLLRQQLRSKSHIVPHGGKQDEFHHVAIHLNSNVDFHILIDNKSIWDQYERILQRFYLE